MRQGFKRRIYDFDSLVRDVGFLVKSSPEIRKALKSDAVSRAFMEKIMTVVTAVNGCSYCTWFHARQAVASGISHEEVANLLKLQFDTDATDFELTGLLYAQHYAETDRQPEASMVSNLVEFYGQQVADQIVLFVRMILFGNLAGNTFDAFLSRIKGEKAVGSNVFFEAAFFFVSAPFLLPLVPFVRSHKT